MGTARLVRKGQSIELLEVPEEPGSAGSGGRPCTADAFITVMGIARWMAKAYGYRAQKRIEYQSQDRLLIQENRQKAFEAATSFAMECKRRNEKPVEAHSTSCVFIEQKPQDSKLKSAAMTGDVEADTRTVCAWIASSFGEIDPAYYKAYSRELVRQSRGMPGVEEKKLPSWM